MTALRPNCAVCHANPRAEGSARCEDCGPGRIQPPRPRLRSAERAALALGADPDDTTTEAEETGR